MSAISKFANINAQRANIIYVDHRENGTRNSHIKNHINNINGKLFVLRQKKKKHNCRLFYLARGNVVESAI